MPKQPDDDSSPVDQAPSVQEELEAEKLRLAEEWDNLRAEQANLAQEKQGLEVEKAQITQGWDDLRAKQAALAQEKQGLAACRRGGFGSS